MKLSKVLIILLLLIVAFSIGFIVGFGYVSDNPMDALSPEAWRTFLEQLRSF